MKPYLKIITIATMLIAMIIIGPGLVSSQNGWSGAMPVSDGDANLSDDTLVVAVHNQNAYAVWGDGQFHLSTLQSGTWSADQTISNFSGYTPALAAGANGRLHLAWIDGSSLMTSYSVDSGQSWSEAEQLDSTGEDPILVTGGDGLLYLAWKKNGGVKVAHSSDGGQNWSSGQWTAANLYGECVTDWTMAAANNGAVLAFSDSGAVSVQQVTGSGVGPEQPVYSEDNCDNGPDDLAIGDDGERLYLVWGGSNGLNLTSSGNSGTSWSSLQDIPNIGGGDSRLATFGSGQLLIANRKSGFVYVYESSDGGQNWQSSSFGPVEDEFTLAVDAQSGLGVVVWDGLFESGIYAATKQLTGQPPVLLTGTTLNDANQPLANTHLIITPEDGGPAIDAFADVQGNFAVDVSPGLYTITPVLNGYYFEPLGVAIPIVDPPDLRGTKLGEIISVRALNDTTVGVVGFINRDYATAATLQAGDDSASTVDVFPLAGYNAPGGGQNRTIPETLGLWSATLPADTFSENLNISLTLTDVDGRSHLVSVSQPAPPPGELTLQNIKKGDNGKVDISGQITAGADSLTLSHWQRPDAAAGIAWPGQWDEKSFKILPDGQWAFEGVDTQDGENLYRVQTPDGLEDIEGYYYITNTTEDLHVEENKQRKQALVFRDVVRNILADPKYGDFPDQLIVAIGTTESGGTTENLSGFSNVGSGIMQVTCVSGYQGFTTKGEFTKCPLEIYKIIDPDILTDPHPERPLTPGGYEETSESIIANVSDAMLLFDSYYRDVKPFDRKQPPRGKQVIKDNNMDVDALITTVAYYNKGSTFLTWYETFPSESIYLGRVAKQLLHNPEGGNNISPLSVAEFFADLDYIGNMTNLVERLQCGQAQVDSFLNGSEFIGCEAGQR